MLIKDAVTEPHIKGLNEAMRGPDVTRTRCTLGHKPDPWSIGGQELASGSVGAGLTCACMSARWRKVTRLHLCW